MKARQTRVFMRDLGRMCRENDLEMTKHPARGSHMSIVIKNPQTDQSITFVITSHKEVSPGVQREVLKYVGSIAGRLALGELLHDILKRLFD